MQTWVNQTNPTGANTEWENEVTMNEASDLNKTDQVGMSFPLFRWTYHFDMEEAPYDGDTVPEADLEMEFFDQNPIFNGLDSFENLPQNFKFNTKCWLPDKFVKDYDVSTNRFGLRVDEDTGSDTDVIRLPDDAQETVLCPDVHPRFDHDWNFRFLKGELTEIPDLQKSFNYLIEKYFEKRFKAKTLLDVWSRSDLSTADRPLPFSRWKPVTWFVNADGNNHGGHYTGGSTLLDVVRHDQAGPKGDAVVTSPGVFPHKTSYKAESLLRPHPFKMYVLNNQEYDIDEVNNNKRPWGLVISPDTNVTTVYGKTGDGEPIEFEPENPTLQMFTRNDSFAPSFFKTGILEAFFEKNSALEWPKGYVDSLTPEQRYTPIRMLFNDILGTYNYKKVKKKFKLYN